LRAVSTDLIIRAFSRLPPPPRTQPNPIHHGLKFINSDFQRQLLPHIN
jgi:hypothetical protein